MDKLAPLPVIIVSSRALFIRSIAFSLVGAQTISYKRITNQQHINILLSKLFNSNIHDKFSNYSINIVRKSSLPNFRENRIIFQTGTQPDIKNSCDFKASNSFWSLAFEN